MVRAGDVVPADCRVIESHGLLVDEATLIGESYPAEVSPGVIAIETPLAGWSNSLFMGTHVASGAGQAVVVATGRLTEFGAVSARLATRGRRGGNDFGNPQRVQEDGQSSARRIASARKKNGSKAVGRRID